MRVMLTRTLRHSAAGLAALGLLTLAGAAGLGACSASLDLRYCERDADCQRFSADGPLRCDVPSGVCMTATCDGHDECAALGDGFVCGLKSLCVDALVDGCEFAVLPGGKVEDPTVVVGAIVDRGAPVGDATLAAMRLAIEDFNSKATLADGSRIALLACDGEGTSSGARSAAEHLAKVGVPALLGPGEDDAFLTVGEKVSVITGNNIFTITPTAAAPIGFADPTSLLWRATPSTPFQGQAIQDRVSDLEPATAVLLFRNDLYGLTLFDGATVVDADNNWVLPGVPQQSNLSYTNAAEAIAAYDTLLGVIPAPEVLVVLGGDEVGPLLGHIAASGKVPPKILIADRGLAAVPPALVEAGSAALLASIEVIAPLRSHPENGPLFAARFAAKFPGLTVSDEVNLAYDAAMVTVAAMRAIPANKRILGPTIAASIARLTSGAAVSFNDFDGLSFIPTIAAQLDMGSAVDLVGVSGELDLKGGEPCSPMIAWAFSDLAAPVAKVAGSYEFTSCPAITGSWDM